MKTPVAFIIFNRPDTTARVFEAIRQAKPPLLLVIADGARASKSGEIEKCAATRAIIDGVDWDCEVRTNYSDVNLGCGKRVSSGLDWVFQEVEEAIILEDDCLPHPTFFQFCEELLECYRDDTRIMSIIGNNLQMGKSYSDNSYYFSHYNHVWGWASWRRAWKHYDFRMTNWPKIKDGNFLNSILDRPEALRYWSQIFDQMYKDEIDTWDYQWIFSCWSQNALTVVPEINLISNIGYGADATHTFEICSLANIPVAEMKIPLIHPELMIINSTADRFTDRILYNINIFSYMKSKLSSLLKISYIKSKLRPLLKKGNIL
jgi:hypothetical protein